MDAVGQALATIAVVSELKRAFGDQLALALLLYPVILAIGFLYVLPMWVRFLLRAVRR